MSEAKVNEALLALHEEVNNVLSRKSNRVLRAIGESRLAISDLLAKHSEEDGKIPSNKLTAVLTELTDVEAQMYRNLRDEVRLEVKDVAERSSHSISEAVIGALGTGALLSFIGIAELDALTNEAIFGALVGIGVMQFVTSVVTSVFNRKGDDGLTLIDRLDSLASMLINEIRDTLRVNIMKGEDNAVIIRKLNDVIEETDWRVKTIVETESMFALRQSIGKFGEESKVVKAVKIVDFPHGDPKEHRRHKCYIYAHSDEHGLGEGVYPVTTLKIRNPHPRCRSLLQYVLVDEFR